MALTKVPKSLSSTPSILDNEFGVDITGTVTADGLAIIAANASGTIQASSATDATLNITSDGITAYSLVTSGTDSSFAIKKDGAERLHITTTGNIGIGTSSPSGLLDLTSTSTTSLDIQGGDGNSKNLVFRKTTGGAQQAKISAVGDDLRFTTGPTSERMRIDSAGNVGIGRTSISQPSAGATTLAIQGTSTDKGGAIRLYSSDDSVAAYIYLDNSSGLSINTQTSHPMVFRTANVECMRIDSAGNVGIGVTPLELLHIESDTTSPAMLVKAGGQVGSTTPTAELILSSGSLSSNDSACKVISYRIGDYSTAAVRTSGLKFQTTNANAPVTAMAIDNLGNVGIAGQTNPTYNLDGGFVNQTWGWYLNSSYNAGFTYNTTERSLSISTKSAENIDHIKFATGSAATERMRIDGAGNVGIGTTSPVNNSNRRTLGLQAAWGGQLDIMVGATVHAQFGTDNFSSGQSCRIQSQDGIVFKAGGSAERLRIDEFGGLVIKSVGGATTAAFYGNNIVNGITAVPSAAGTPFVLGRDTGTLRSAHFGGNLRFDSGYGVEFSVAGGTGTSTSGTLDDYEEGTWTPVIIAVGLGGNTATATMSGPSYTKVGRLVTAQVYISGIDINSITAGTYITLQGLPFTATNYADFTIAYKGGDWSTSGNIIGGYVQSGQSYAYFMRADGVEAQQGSTDVTMTKAMINITYQTS